MAILMCYPSETLFKAALIFKFENTTLSVTDEDIEGTGHFLLQETSFLSLFVFFSSSNTGATTNNNMQYSGLTYIFLKLNIPGDSEVFTLIMPLISRHLG